MMRKETTLTLVILTGFFLAGCASVAKTYTFPSAWPVGLGQPTRSPLMETKATPSVGVQRLQVAVAEPAEGQTVSKAAQTADVLTDRLVERLNQKGIPAGRVSSVNPSDDYLLRVSIPRMDYTIQSGYPKRVIYATELELTMVHRTSGQVAWERKLTENFQETEILNMMSRLPKKADPHQEILLSKGIDPLMDRVAAGLGPLLTRWEEDLKGE